MFVTRARYDALYARYVEVVDERDAARQEAAESSDSVIQLAASAARAGQDAERARALVGQVRSSGRLARRLGRAIRACARYRADAMVLRHQLAVARAQYDHAVGLDSPALDDGARWQERRTDRPVPKQRGAES
jgi:hypothetical protein